jgi:murein DD-endopeptidase MepM/ murein hydrolase activator NlpD
VGAVIAFLLLGASVATWAGASTTKSRLSSATDRLHRLERQIGAENGQLKSMQGQLDAMASRIDGATTQYQQTEQLVMDTRNQLAAVQGRYQGLRGQLDRRAAYTYMEGPGSSLELILGSTSLADFTDRLEFIDSVQLNDSNLAIRVQRLAAQLHEREASLAALLAKQAVVIRRYNAAQDQLNAAFQQEQSIRADLSHKQAQVGTLVRRLKSKLKAEELAAARAAAQQAAGGIVNIGSNPFHTCPVGNPHAFTDDFGQPRYTTNPPHPHAGIDIMAPMGTPIYATFDGVASDASGGLGGLAVIVQGADGSTYNAHLSSFGTLGNVTAGTIVGYVGNTGDAAGGATHDHFEWHPNAIPKHPYVSPYGYSEVSGAIDSYPYLTQVC